MYSRDPWQWRRGRPEARLDGMDPLRPLPDSPCVRNCCLDDDEVCLGCGRHLSEITGWMTATAEQRDAILERAAQRQARRACPWKAKPSD